MIHHFPTRTAALRSLMDISIAAVTHAKCLITEEDGMFCFDEDQAEQYLNTQDNTNANLENTMITEITLENFKSASTADLVAFYNDYAESSVKKFRDRATAEKKVQIILEALAAEVPAVKPEPMIGNLSLSATVAFAKSVSAKKAKPTKAEKPVKAPKASKSVMSEMIQALIHDPMITPPEAREPKAEAVSETKVSEGRTVSDTQAETMKTTLKLDRTITYIASGETWKNAFQMWKAHTDWMTSAQQDGLTAKLYKAAKNGEQITVVINSRAFQLKNV